MTRNYILHRLACVNCQSCFQRYKQTNRKWLGSSRVPNAVQFVQLDDVQNNQGQNKLECPARPAQASISLDIWQEVMHFYTFYTFTKQHFLSPFRSFSKGVTGVKPLRKMWHGWSKQALIKAVDTKKQTLFGLNLYYACISAIALCPLHCPSVRVSTELAIHSSGWSRGSYSCLPDKVRSVHVGSWFGTKQNWSMRIHET